MPLADRRATASQHKGHDARHDGHVVAEDVLRALRVASYAGKSRSFGSSASPRRGREAAAWGVAAKPDRSRRRAPGSRIPNKLAKSLVTCAPNERPPLSRIRQLVALCMLLGAVVTIGLAIAGALKGTRSPVPQLASQK
jgi:hypothetical protein